MEESTLSKLNKYKRVIEVDEFIDFLYSKKFITEENYYAVWQKKEPDRIHKLFEIINSKPNLEDVFSYLYDKYPDEERRYKNQIAYRESVALGGFPQLPPNYVSRKSQGEDVKRELLNLGWDKKLVIHGMMGYGKSCLVNEILSDFEIRKYFDNHLFWINLGDCHQKENALLPMWRLYTAASGTITSKICHQEDDIDNLKKSLIKLFLEPRLHNSLLILDDVDSENVLSCFDIRCKTVITTQNKNILRNEEAVHIEVKTGFSRTESLELFKKSLKIDYDLPVSADEIHHICRGHPMLIALIGSYLSENAEYVRGGDEKVWDYIKSKFMMGEYILNEYNTTEVDILQMIKKCIETLLTDNLKDLYQHLAIFPLDVNIPPNVLEILWEKNRHQVRNIMNKFAEKSLIVLFYHKDLQTHIYGIHDIHLNYLKDIMKDKTVQLHRRLLSGYDNKTNENYANLPNDNYTLQYIGYHLLNGEMFDKFDIYLDLGFLGAKVKAVGKEDVLRDMDKYKVYITRELNLQTEKLNQYKDFIQRCGGNLYSYKYTDIIQYALRENKDSHVFKDALKVAKTSEYLYFKLKKPCEELDYSQRINVRDDITSACYMDSPQNILIGTTNGRIKLFYEQSEKEISSFVGHTGAIRSLIVSPDKRYFLSVSFDGTVIMWKFTADSSRNSRDFSNEQMISPKTKQSFWQDIYTPDRGQVSPRRTFRIPDADDSLISAEFCSNFPNTYRIITGSERGNVIVWDAQTGDRLFNTGHRGLPAQCVLYLDTDDYNVVIFACQDDIFIYELNDHQLQYYKQLHNVNNCNFLFAIEDELIAVSEKCLTQWRWRWQGQLQRVSKEKIYEITDANTINICSTLTVDNQYLVVSTSRNTVYIWDIQQKKMVREFENRGLAKSLDTYFDEDRSVHILLIGSDKKTLYQCHIQPHEREPQTENMPICTPYWKKMNALTVAIGKENRIQVFNGYILISESDVINSKVTSTCFSSCGNEVIYGLSNGEINVFKIRSKSCRLLQSECGVSVTYLKSFDPNNCHSSHRRCLSTDSAGSSSLDSLDVLDSYSEIVIAVFNDNLIKVYTPGQNVYERNISNPKIFYKSNSLIIIDHFCCVYSWNLCDDVFVMLSNPNISNIVNMVVAAFSLHKSTLAIIYDDQKQQHFLDIYSVLDGDDSLELTKRLKLVDGVKSVCFSADGMLLAVGFITGEIKVWNLKENYTSRSLPLHDDPVEELLFSPNMEPILVSVGAEIAWWNLAPFQKTSTKARGKPPSIDILENVTTELGSMDFSYWKDRRPIEGFDLLLSRMKLGGKAKYISASNDFNCFLAIDDNGKVYIMEIVRPDSD